jgi:hypothetical protein
MTRTKKIISAFALLIVTIVLVLIASALDIFPKSRLESSLRKSIQSNRGGIITMRDLTTFEWDRMDIYTPYSTYQDAKGKTIDVDEGECLLVFTKKGLPVSLLKYNRFYGDFSGLYHKGGYSPLDARFKVPGGIHRYWLKLEWVQDKSPTSGSSGSLRSLSVMLLFTSNSQFYVITKNTCL